MKTRLVAHLAVAAVLGASLGTPLAAQDSPAPRPRASAEDRAAAQAQRPRARVTSPLRTRQAEPPRLGVYIDLTEDGMRVTRVEDGSLAATAGVQAGDLLLRLDGQALDDVEVLREVLASARPGQSLPLGIVRDGQGLVKLEVVMPRPEPRPAPEGQRRAAPGNSDGGFLGVELGQASAEGVAVADVVDGTAAWFAGLQSGDVLHSIDGHPVEAPEDFVDAVSSRKAGSMITLAWSRGDDDHAATVRLGHRAAQPLSMALPGNNNMLFPGAIATPDGHALYFGPGNGQGAPNTWQFFGDDGEGFVFDTDGSDVDWHAIQGQLGGSMNEWIEQLHEHLKDMDVDVQGTNSKIQIQIEDGVMTIEKDGETQVIELGDKQALRDALQNVRLHGLQLNRQGALRQLLRLGNDGAAGWVLGDGDADIRVLREGDGDCQLEIECKASSDCDALIDCDTSIDCDTETSIECDTSPDADVAPEAQGEIS